ncbi:glycosyltransferase family 4 protein [Phycisphaeraceae bacterium D3-23]
MNIIQCHNYYQIPGGEDAVVEDERALLVSHGHNVTQFTRHNDDVKDVGAVRLAAGTVWSRAAARDLEVMVRKEKAAVVHFHNTMPMISPSAYYAARRAGAAVVQTLHNYRLLCPKGTFFREGTVCEKCLGKPVAWPAVRHACYRDSRVASAVLTVMGTTHRLFRTYHRAVDAYIAASEFTRGKMLVGGLPKDRLHVKPNFVLDDPGVGSGDGGYALFLGRLSPEKGLDTLIAAWDRMECLVPLKIVGSGPMEDEARQLAARHEHVECLGWVGQPGLGEVIRGARVLVLPSLNYEGFPKVIVEAYAAGLPIVASRLGSMGDAIVEGTTGRLFEPGDVDDLAKTMASLFHDTDLLASMRGASRAAYETYYTAQVNYAKLLDVYHVALERRASASELTSDPAATEQSR